MKHNITDPSNDLLSALQHDVLNGCGVESENISAARLMGDALDAIYEPGPATRWLRSERVKNLLAQQREEA